VDPVGWDQALTHRLGQENRSRRVRRTPGRRGGWPRRARVRPRRNRGAVLAAQKAACLLGPRAGERGRPEVCEARKPCRSRESTPEERIVKGRQYTTISVV
jgi:hypothetical protein